MPGRLPVGRGGGPAIRVTGFAFFTKGFPGRGTNSGENKQALLKCVSVTGKRRNGSWRSLENPGGPFCA